MRSALLLVALALPAAATELGGHDAPWARAEPSARADERRAALEELWQRRILPPDQSAWSPEDFELLRKIRAAEKDALSYLKRRAGGTRPWTAKPRTGTGRPLLTKEGYERYGFLLSQEAIEFFEGRGVDAKDAFKLRDLDGKPFFDAEGRITEAGAAVYRRARLNLEAYWKTPDGEISGTRRPPMKTP